MYIYKFIYIYIYIIDMYIYIPPAEILVRKVEPRTFRLNKTTSTGGKGLPEDLLPCTSNYVVGIFVHPQGPT